MINSNICLFNCFDLFSSGTEMQKGIESRSIILSERFPTGSINSSTLATLNSSSNRSINNVEPISSTAVATVGGLNVYCWKRVDANSPISILDFNRSDQVQISTRHGFDSIENQSMVFSNFAWEFDPISTETVDHFYVDRSRRGRKRSAWFFWRCLLPPEDSDLDRSITIDRILRDRLTDNRWSFSVGFSKTWRINLDELIITVPYHIKKRFESN